MSLGFYLALKELWRSRGKFVLFSLVIALITVLVLFVAALGEGLGAGNREYLAQLNGELVIYQEGVELSIARSRIARSKINDIHRVDGVRDAGPVGFSSVSLVVSADRLPLDVSMIGVEPGKPGEPAVRRGAQLGRRSQKGALIDANVAALTGLDVGDILSVKSIQGTVEELYTLEVLGVTDSQKYSIRPSIFVPYLTWDKVRPRGANETGTEELVYNIVVVSLEDLRNSKDMVGFLERQVENITAVDKKTAYEATPGYSAQQSTLNTQRTFALLIGILVIGGFFQIQTLQKVGQIGMLKAIGGSNSTVVVAAIVQVVAVTVMGILMGTVATLAISLSFPPNIPIIFEPRVVGLSVVSLLLIGPLGSLVSIRYALKVEPLAALGLSS